MAHEESLVLLVKEHPALYDKRHKDYSDRRAGGVVSNIWAKVYTDMVDLGFDLKDATTVQSTWTNLKQAYFAAMRRREKASGSKASYMEPWRLEKQMAWLNDYCYKQTMASNIPETTSAVSIQEKVMDVVPEDVETASPAPSSTTCQSAASPAPSSASNMLSPPAKKRKTADPIEEGLMSHLNTVGQAIVNRRSPDDSDNVGVMVASQHRALNARQKKSYLKKLQKSFMEVLEEESDDSYLACLNG